MTTLLRYLLTKPMNRRGSQPQQSGSEPGQPPQPPQQPGQPPINPPAHYQEAIGFWKIAASSGWYLTGDTGILGREVE